MTRYYRTDAGAAALKFARELTGRPYVYGGTWPSSGGTDCSGLCQWAYEQVGVLLARTTYAQYKQFPLPHSAVSEPGDLLFIAGSDAIGHLPGHVMMFVEHGQVFQAEFTGGPPIGQFPYNTSIFEYRTRPALALPMPPPPAKPPTADDLRRAGLVGLHNPAEAALATKNGWPIYIWNGHWFTPIPIPHPGNPTEYANVDFKIPSHR